MVTSNLLYSRETRAIIGCMYDVFNSMPRFAEEALYQEAVEVALYDAGIPYESQKEIHPQFHGRRLAHTYRPDLICYGKIVVELKAVSQLLPAHFGQLRNYMGLLRMRVGLLVNFHAFPLVDIKRLYLGDLTDAGSVTDIAQEAPARTKVEAGACGRLAPQSGNPASPRKPATFRPRGESSTIVAPKAQYNL